MSKRWLLERRRDQYYRLAKEEGYRSRAAYKLLQASKRHRFIKHGDVVVDLGAAPGGWMQAARTMVGDGGYVLGVDLEPIRRFEWKNVSSIVEDITDPESLESIRENLPRDPDVILSDASPDISGVWEVDHARQIDLARASLRIATETLRPGGSFFVKVFQGDLLEDFINEVKRRFDFVKRVKPKASRARSSEIYILALNLNPEMLESKRSDGVVGGD